MEHLLTVKEVAAFLNLDEKTVYRLTRKGKIPAVKIGGNWRFKREALEEWLLHKTVGVKLPVLVVDDDPTLREVLVEMVQKQGYEAVAAATGEAASERAAERNYGLVFLDLVLPDVSGVEVLKRLRSLNKTAVVVIVTGYPEAALASEALSEGPLLLLSKPFQARDIEQILDLAMTPAEAR